MLINLSVEKQHYKFVINLIFPKELKKEDKYMSLTYFRKILRHNFKNNTK